MQWIERWWERNAREGVEREAGEKLRSAMEGTKEKRGDSESERTE